MKEAITQNEHWKTGKIAIPRAKKLIKREIFSKLEEALRTKFIVILRGIRRIGKSVLARQLLQKSLETLKPQEIAWFEFDRSMGAKSQDLDELINFFKNRGAKLIVFDEILFVNSWQDVLKKHYDLTDMKFIVAGSSGLELDKRSAESLSWEVYFD